MFLVAGTFLLAKQIHELFFVYHKHRHLQKDLLIPCLKVGRATKPLFFNHRIFDQGQDVFDCSWDDSSLRALTTFQGKGLATRSWTK
jgi:hypothetical protein